MITPFFSRSGKQRALKSSRPQNAPHVGGDVRSLQTLGAIGPGQRMSRDVVRADVVKRAILTTPCAVVGQCRLISCTWLALPGTPHANEADCVFLTHTTLEIRLRLHGDVE